VRETVHQRQPRLIVVPKDRLMRDHRQGFREIAAGVERDRITR
jgi:hypothetical protein